MEIALFESTLFDKLVQLIEYLLGRSILKFFLIRYTQILH